MKKIFILSLGALALGGAILLPRAVNAYRGDASVLGPNCNPEDHLAISEAFEAGDYQAWQARFANRGRMAERVTEENFARFAEAHRLSLEGKTEQAAAIRQELGLGQGGQHRGANAGGNAYRLNR